MKFVEIRGNFYSLNAIVSVRKAPKRTGVDNVTRNWVVQVIPEATGGSSNPKHSSIWCSDEEVAETLDAIKATRLSKPAEGGC